MSRSNLFIAAFAAASVLSSGCTFNEIASKEDLSETRTGLSEEILNVRRANEQLGQQLKDATERMTDLASQIEEMRAASARSAQFTQAGLEEINAALEGATQGQNAVSAEFSEKLQVVLEEIAAENSRLHKRIDRVATLAAPEQEGGIHYADGKPVYTVASGDTLSEIAQSAGITVQELIRLNNLKNPDRLRIGQQLVLAAE